jgi:hypothetical protein
VAITRPDFTLGLACTIRCHSPSTNPASLGGMIRPSREMLAFGLVQRAQELL